MVNALVDPSLDIGLFALHRRSVPAEFAGGCAVRADSPALRQSRVGTARKRRANDQPKYRPAVIAEAGSGTAPVLRESSP